MVQEKKKKEPKIVQRPLGKKLAERLQTIEEIEAGEPSVLTPSQKKFLTKTKEREEKQRQKKQRKNLIQRIIRSIKDYFGFDISEEEEEEE